MKVNHFAGVNNSTFLFDEQKENDIGLNISNINGGGDFFENSINSNFKQELLNTDAQLISDNTKIDLESSKNNINSNKLDDKDSLIVREDTGFLFRNRYKVIAASTLIFIIILIFIKLIV